MIVIYHRGDAVAQLCAIDQSTRRFICPSHSPLSVSPVHKLSLKLTHRVSSVHGVISNLISHKYFKCLIGLVNIPRTQYMTCNSTSSPICSADPSDRPFSAPSPPLPGHRRIEAAFCCNYQPIYQTSMPEAEILITTNRLSCNHLIAYTGMRSDRLMFGELGNWS